MTKRPTINMLHVYDRVLNIYADRGNIEVLRRRAAWRGIDVRIVALAPGETFDPGEHDLIYIGGGQDRDQRLVAEHLRNDLGQPIRRAVEEGAAVLAVCGGYQLLGHEYLDASGTTQAGVGVFDATTTAGSTRLIGNVAIECDLPAIGAFPAKSITVAGFENHAGRTTLGPDARPFGTVIAGYGNDGSGVHEGCRLHRAVGTYLHGPLLPRNPALADWLLAGAVAHGSTSSAATSTLELLQQPVDDIVAGIERAAATRSLERARAEHA